MQKKILASLMVAVMAITNNSLTSVNGFEEESIITNKTCVVTSESDEIANLENGFDKDGSLSKKLEYDVDNNVTKLPDEIEEQLNEIGVFDEDINSLNSDTIKELSKACNISVQIEYTGIDKDDEVFKMNNGDINDLIDECIDDNTIEYEEYEEKQNFLDNILTKVGIIPEKVYGAGRINEQNSEKRGCDGVSESGAMKQLIYAYQWQKGGQLYVVASATWLKEAHYRNKDVFSVHVGGTTIIPKHSECTHTVNAVIINPFDIANIQTGQLKTNPTAHVYSGNNNSLAYTVDLFGTRGEETAFVGYVNEKIEIKVRCNVSGKGNKTVPISTHYMHCKTSIGVSPSVSLDGSGIPGIGVGFNVAAKYEEITNNAILNYPYLRK